MIGCGPEWGLGELHTPGTEEAGPSLGGGLQDCLWDPEKGCKDSPGAAGRGGWAGQGWGPTVAPISQVGPQDLVRKEGATKLGPGPWELIAGQQGWSLMTEYPLPQALRAEAVKRHWELWGGATAPPGLPRHLLGGCIPLPHPRGQVFRESKHPSSGRVCARPARSCLP